VNQAPVTKWSSLDLYAGYKERDASLIHNLHVRYAIIYEVSDIREEFLTLVI
jgi:hypothetical protein